METFRLKDKNEIPVIGLGTWQLAGKTCIKAVETALKTGYRHIDTAEIYGNQQEIGRAVRKSAIKRKDIFITSKVWRSNLKKENTVDSCKETLEALQTDYLDLFLIHWPNRTIPVEETFEAMELLKQKGLIKSYGVSNFTIDLLRKIPSKFKPVVNQVEFHPSLNQKKLKSYCDKNSIVVIAYSPLAQGLDLKLPEVKKLSRKYRVSTAQVILNWLRNKKIVAIPRSKDKGHVTDNFKSLNWQLEDKDIKLLNGLNKHNRLVNPGFSEFTR